MKKEIALPNCRPDRARATVPVTIETEHNSYKKQMQLLMQVYFNQLLSEIMFGKI